MSATALRAQDASGPACQSCGGALKRDDPVDGGSDPTTTHRGYRCQDCDRAGAVIVRDGDVVRRVGPAVDPAFGGRSR